MFTLRDQWFPTYPTVAMQLFQEAIEALLSPSIPRDAMPCSVEQGNQNDWRAGLKSDPTAPQDANIREKDKTDAKDTRSNAGSEVRHEESLSNQINMPDEKSGKGIPHVPPTSFHAMPLPRLGCGGPAHNEDEKEDEGKQTKGSKRNFQHENAEHPSEGISQPGVPITICPGQSETSEHKQNQGPIFKKAKNDTSDSLVHKASTGEPHVPPTRLHAMPLPRLGCGGPSQVNGDTSDSMVGSMDGNYEKSVQKEMACDTAFRDNGGMPAFSAKNVPPCNQSQRSSMPPKINQEHGPVPMQYTAEAGPQANSTFAPKLQSVAFQGHPSQQMLLPQASTAEANGNKLLPHQEPSSPNDPVNAIMTNERKNPHEHNGPVIGDPPGVADPSRCTDSRDQGSMHVPSFDATGGIAVFSGQPSQDHTLNAIDQPTCSNVDQTSRMANAILRGDLIILDFDVMQYHTIAHSKDQTFQDLAHAMGALKISNRYVLDLLGNPVDLSKPIAQLQIVAIGTKPIEIARSLRHRTWNLHGQPRKESLFQQQGAVAVDEMFFYLSSLACLPDTRAVSPLILSGLDDAAILATAWSTEVKGQGQRCATAIWFNSHWIAVVADNNSQVPRVLTTMEGVEIWPLLFPSIQSSDMNVHVPCAVAQAFQEDCGFQSVAWITDMLVGRIHQPMEVKAAAQWRFLFWQHLLMKGNEAEVRQLLLGGQSEVETAIAALLKEHGVFNHRVMDRTKQVIQTIGQHPLTQALRSTRPWVATKELANQQSPKLRLIWEDEFDQVVKQRTGKESTFGGKKKKQPTKMNLNPIFTANDIVIPPGVFCSADGTAVAQIPLRNVSPTATGIVVASESEVQPFLSQRQVSKESLAFLVLTPYTPEIQAHGQVVRFPAQCIATGEPVLLNAIMIQKGASLIGRATPRQPLQIDTVETQTVKVLMYRDQAATAWDEVVDRPVKCILDQIPAIRVCKKEGCNCQCWHKDSEEGTEPILDIWQRDYLSIHFKKVRPTEAGLFTCMMRVTAKAFECLNQQSGLQGIYIEARSPDGRSQDDSFHTVWLPKMSYDDARAAQATAENNPSLVRVTNRYGLRLKVNQAKNLHDSIRPDVPFLGGTSKATWVIGPIPFGTTRKGLVKLFQEWNWNAKPLQPIGPAADRTGLRWQIISDSPPEHYVYTLSHGDVLIVKMDPHEPKTNMTGQVEASWSTCRAVASNTAMQDPWAEAAARLPKQSSAALSPAQMASLENTVEQRILKRIQTEQDTEMTPAVDNRITELENRMNQLQYDQQTISQSQQVLEKRVEHFGQQFDAQTHKLQGHLEDKLAEQITRIEALLSKRPRQE